MAAPTAQAGTIEQHGGTERGAGRGSRRYLLAGALAASAYFWAPGLVASSWLFNAVGMSAALALVIGARRHRPRQATAWYLLAAAQVAFVAGDVAYYGYELAFPSVGDLFYLSAYPLQIGGLVVMIRSRYPGRDRSAVIDSAIVAAGAAVLSWGVLIEPYVRDGDLSMVAKAVAVAHPVLDVAFLAFIARLAAGRGARPPAARLLATGFVLLLATDVVYATMELGGGYHQGSWVDGGWLAYYVLLGAAALHPTMRALSEPAPDGRVRLTRVRLALLAAATLMAPAVEAAQSARSQPPRIPVVALGSAVLFLLVLWRMAGLVAGLRAAVAAHQRAVERERVLRRSAEVVGAALD
ncbi:MAG: hypothetical protein ACRD0F_07675, partial [Acidimicrobiales bacterium]